MGGLSFEDILFVISRHWAKIAILSVLGLTAGVFVYFVLGATYESNAKVLVRYVLERNSIDREASSLVERNDGRREGMNLINDEMEILQSWDLVKAVAKKVGVERFEAKGKGSETEKLTGIAKGILTNMEVVNKRGSNVISVTLKGKTSDLTADVLNELIRQYFEKHLEIHRSSGASKLIAEQSELVHKQIERTEEELIRTKREVGVFQIPAGKNEEGVGQRSPDVRKDLIATEGERAAQEARIKTLEAIVGRSPVVGKGSESEQRIGEEQFAEYQEVVDTVGRLRERGLHLVAKFPPESGLVMQNQREIDSLEMRRRRLVEEFPMLATVKTGDVKEKPIDLDAERAALAALDARLTFLKQKAEELRKAEDSLPDALSRIRRLEQLQKIQEESYQYLTTATEKARIDEMLDPSRMPNISVIQAPSPPDRETSKAMKKVAALLVLGGLGSGIGLSFLIELFLDTRVKRKEEIERRLGIPVFASIPCADALHPGDRGVASVDARDLLARLSKSVAQGRDGRRTRLVGVTGAGLGVGASTIARELENACRLAGEKAIVVDVMAGKGQPGSVFDVSERVLGAIPEALEHLETIGGKQLLELVAQYRDSSYDFILFDLPPVGSGSPTWALADSMDKVLLIASPDHTEGSELRRCHKELVAAGASVACVFNKQSLGRPNLFRKAFLREGERVHNPQRGLVGGGRLARLA